jgi:hypothetical protein
VDAKILEDISDDDLRLGIPRMQQIVRGVSKLIAY